MTRDEQARYVGTQKLDRLSRWTSRKPLIALMGEFSAGKSTLLNLLIGESILPTKVTATQMPPVWLRFGTEAPFRMDTDGVRHPVDLDNLASVPLKDTRFIRIYSESGYLKECDLLDTPGISDPKIPMKSWVKTIGYANAVLWCTHAAQAWRESERSAWESLPERLRKHSLLVVTRADKLESSLDRDKIDRRLGRETDDLFSGRKFISLTRALAARADGADPQGWADCGAEAFMGALTGIVEEINLERGNLLWRYQLDDNADTAPEAVDQTDLTADEEPVAVVQNELMYTAPAEEPVEFEIDEQESDGFFDNNFPVGPEHIRPALDFVRPSPGPEADGALHADLADGAAPADTESGRSTEKLDEKPVELESLEIFNNLRAALAADDDQTGSEGDDTDANIFAEQEDQTSVSEDWQAESFTELDPLDLFLLENPLDESAPESGSATDEQVESDKSRSNIVQPSLNQGHHFDEEYDAPTPTLADVEQFSAIIAGARSRPDEFATPSLQSVFDNASEATIVRSIWNDIQDNYNIKALPHMQSAFQQLLAKLEGPVPVVFHANLDRHEVSGD